MTEGTLAGLDDLPEIVIRPSKGWRWLDLRELWAYRELIYFLTWRDIKVRYKQTAIGVAWAVLQPLAMMGVFTLFFGQMARSRLKGWPTRCSCCRAWCPGSSLPGRSPSRRAAW